MAPKKKLYENLMFQHWKIILTHNWFCIYGLSLTKVLKYNIYWTFSFKICPNFVSDNN